MLTRCVLLYFLYNEPFKEMCSYDQISYRQLLLQTALLRPYYWQQQLLCSFCPTFTANFIGNVTTVTDFQSFELCILATHRWIHKSDEVKPTLCFKSLLWSLKMQLNIELCLIGKQWIILSWKNVHMFPASNSLCLSCCRYCVEAQWACKCTLLCMKHPSDVCRNVTNSAFMAAVLTVI